MKFFMEKPETIAKKFSTNPTTGLTTSQVDENRKMFGENTFEEQKKETMFQKICHQVMEIMNVILLFTAALSFYLSLQDPNEGYIKSIVIFSIVVINIAVSIFQEGRAENALAALKKLSSPSSTVIREGNTMTIPSNEIVNGDLLVLSTGDQIGADVRLLSSNSLQIDESSLTGESIAIDKNASSSIEENAPLGDQLNMAFSGTNVLNGNGIGIVVGVGMDSQMGQIARLLKGQSREKTPLQKRIDALAKKLAALAFLSGALIFFINYYNGSVPLFENLMTAVVLGVAAVPETLPVIVTLSLIYGVENMANKKAIIRNIPAVETLGSATVIASDKTGTLTQNRMAIQRLWVVGSTPKNTAEMTEWNTSETELLNYFSLASNATATKEDENNWVVHGDPTETAIIDLLLQRKRSKEALEQQYERVLEIPFDSSRKKMTTVHKYNDKYIVLTKGAFDGLIQEVENEQELAASNVHAIHDSFAEDALRVLALSYKFVDTIPSEEEYEELERNQTFYGIIGIIDPPRPETKASVAIAQKAGIKTIMITGDHVLTAKAIAQELNIFQEGDLAITGAELAAIDKEELAANIEKYTVYARVSPEDKIEIVQAWQAKGHVVAMTGDGVNDAPSLKAADVGTAMGIAGTEVAKSASDIILADDNFTTIVNAVSEGRRVYGNIKKTIYYLLSANVAEIIIMLLAAIIGWGIPLTGVQLLFINVLADGIPGFGLSREKAEEGIMEAAPIETNESLFSRGGYRRIFTAATSFTIVSLFAYYLGAFMTIDGVAPSASLGQTMTFLVLSLSSTVHIFVARSNAPIYKSKVRENPMIFVTGIFSILLTIVVALVPMLQTIVGIVPLGLIHWIIVILLSSLIIVVIEIEKMILLKMGKKFLA